MKRKITSNQFKNMIAECVGQVLAESREPQKQQNKRIKMNEGQMQNYVRNIINEELENEGAVGRGLGWIKGAVQGFNGLRQKRKLEQSNKNSDNPKKKMVNNNNTSSWHKFKKTAANQAADSDRNEEFNKLIKKLEALQLNGYFNSRDDIYQDVNNLINKLEYYMSYENKQTQNQYKNNFGVEHPDKTPKTKPSYGMNTNYRQDKGNLIMSR